MRNMWSMRAGICATALCLVQCDFGEDPDEKGESGVVKSTLLVDLSDADARKLCMFNAREFKQGFSSKNAYCIMDTGDSLDLSCEEEVAECLADDRLETYETRIEPICARWTKSMLVYGDDCDANVGDLEACYSVIYGALNDYYKDATCDNINALREERGPDPAACKALDAKCKNFGSSNENSE